MASAHWNSSLLALNDLGPRHFYCFSTTHTTQHALLRGLRKLAKERLYGRTKHTRGLAALHEMKRYLEEQLTAGRGGRIRSYVWNDTVTNRRQDASHQSEYITCLNTATGVEGRQGPSLYMCTLRRRWRWIYTTWDKVCIC
jgi:hypothetical protein